MRPVLQRLAKGLSDVVFPPVCVHCRGLVDADDEASAAAAQEAFQHLCPRCVAQIDFVKAPHCSTCGSPFYGEMDEDTERSCPHCDGLQPEFREGRTATLFKGPVRALVIELKYYRGLHVLRDMERVFRRAAHVRDLVQGAILVPVPLHARKMRKRGYNQSALLAESLAKVAGGGARVENLLQRVVDTGTQTALDRQTRRANLKNAFALAKGAAINSQLHYVLVDDVFTTGSTLNSCARALRRAGVVNLDVVTFGHG